MIGILYEHPEWFLPLFAELDRRGIAHDRLLAHELTYDPGQETQPYALLINRMSPSAYLRGHAPAIFAAQHYLAHLERLGVPVINGPSAYALELSKARQLDLLSHLGLPAPKTRVVNTPSLIGAAARQLAFPVIIKPNVGGSGALMRRFDSTAELAEAATAGELEELFRIDGTAIVQEYHPPRRRSIVRVEVLDGEILYAIRIYNDPDQGFNLCPADICQVPASPSSAGFDLCPAEASLPAVPARKIEAEDPPASVKDAVLRIAEAADLDLCGVEFLESERDSRLYFYDINALSNFVTDAVNVVGFDPFIRLGDLVEQRLRAATAQRARAA
jgi:glutathione synthase/RimK-type ligase-like ATP-grasp enzyme